MPAPPPGLIDEDVRGKDGPVQASFPETDDPVPAAWVDTLAALGLPASGDPSSGEFVGGYINASECSVLPRYSFR